MSIANIGDVDLEYYVEGDGEPLVLIMGFYGTADSWGRPFVDEMARDFKVVRLSNRGVGASTDTGTELSPALMADDVARLIDNLGIESAHVMGISMGGRIAQELAIEHPEKLRRLVLASTDYGARAQPASDAVRATMIQVASTKGTQGSEDFLRLCVAPGRLERGDTFPDGIIPAPPESDILVRQLMAIRSFDAYDRIGHIKADTLVLQGAEDQINPVENGPALQERIPGARLARIEGAGHMFVWEKPAEAAAIVREFLKSGELSERAIESEAEAGQTAVAGS